MKTMKKMHSVEGIVDIVNEGIDEGLIEIVTPEDLIGKFVRIIDAPSSSTLTQEQIEIFKGGCFINGNYLNYVNPVFLPCRCPRPNDFPSWWFGIFIAPQVNGQKTRICQYLLRTDTGTLSVENSVYIDFEQNPSGSAMEINVAHGLKIKNNSGFQTSFDRNVQVGSLNGYTIPSKPSSPPNPNVLAYQTDNTLAWLPYVNNIAPEYDDTATYSVDDLVIYQGVLYKCTTAVETAEAWDATKWTGTTIAELLGS